MCEWGKKEETENKKKRMNNKKAKLKRSQWEEKAK